MRFSPLSCFTCGAKGPAAEEGVTRMLSRMLGVAVICAVSAVAPATAARTVSHSAYARMLQQADAKVARVEAPIERAMTSKATTVAEIRKLMLASGAVSVAL